MNFLVSEKGYFFLIVEISFDIYVKINIDTTGADIMQNFSIQMTLALKGASNLPTFSVF